MQIMKANAEEFDNIYTWYLQDFPEKERKSRAHLEKLMKEESYRLYIAKAPEYDEIMVYAFVYEIPETGIRWLDYFAVNEKYRGEGIGSRFLKNLSTLEKSRGMLLEVEIPGSLEEQWEIQQKRIRFYERLGAVRTPVNYLFPTTEGGFPMYLYFLPAGGQTALTLQELRLSTASALRYIHADIQGLEGILDQVFAQ